MSVNHESGPLIQDDLLDPTNLVEHGRERFFLLARVDPPVPRVREQLLGIYLAVADDQVLPGPSCL
jgi:hypothetical protein